MMTQHKINYAGGISIISVNTEKDVGIPIKYLKEYKLNLMKKK